MKLQQLASTYGRTGAELFTYWDGLIVTTIRTHRHWHQLEGGLFIEFLGLGGVCEPQESFLDCVRRETEEEAGVGVAVTAASQCFYFTRDRRASCMEIDEAVQPYIIYASAHGETPTLGVVYRGELQSAPQPYSEVPALLFLTEAQLLAAVQGRVIIEEILATGGRLLEQEPIPRHAILQPAGAPLRHALLKLYGLI